MKATMISCHASEINAYSSLGQPLCQWLLKGFSANCCLYGLHVLAADSRMAARRHWAALSPRRPQHEEGARKVEHNALNPSRRVCGLYLLGPLDHSAPRPLDEVRHLGMPCIDAAETCCAPRIRARRKGAGHECTVRVGEIRKCAAFLRLQACQAQVESCAGGDMLSQMSKHCNKAMSRILYGQHDLSTATANRRWRVEQPDPSADCSINWLI